MKDKILVVLKFIFALALLPLVVASTQAVQIEVAAFNSGLQHALFSGCIAYVALKFFVYDFGHFYTFGQNILTTAFQFLKPLVNVAPYVLPVYTMLVLLAYGVVMLMGKMGTFQPFFLFALAFTFSMHIILTAQDLYKKDSIPGKSNYFFGMALVYIADVFFMALMMNGIIAGFSFVHFFQTLAHAAGDIYGMIFKQLFLGR
ncbi:MAG: hypothetical protein HQL19_08900 [Candidatus Omnitrophica bacterium]|nr:hypothetical protein [Candidatus Omnitrophota bacterium]